MHQFHVLLITSDGLSSLAADIKEQFAHIEVVEVTQREALSDALSDCSYDALFFQNPLAWISPDELRDLLQMSHPTCLIASCSHANIYRLLNLLSALPDIVLLRNLFGAPPDGEVQPTA